MMNAHHASSQLCSEVAHIRKVQLIVDKKMLVLMKQRVDPRKCAIIIGPVGTSGKGIVRSFVFDSTVVHVKSMANFSVVL
jgi:hypothetical protein